MIRIALWSGPRNISTAMMRAWENRPDTVVWDEPLYAHYLLATGIDHPLREETLAAHETDAARVIEACTRGLPPGATDGDAAIFYQKQMTHHFTDDLPWEWLDRLRHAFLIRDPREMLLSYARKRQTVAAADLGLERQVEIFEHVRRRSGRVPPVIDAADVLRDPRATLSALCRALEVPFHERMLAWPAGPRPSDGAWAPHWYDAVRASTGFAPWRPREGDLPEELASVLAEVRGWYEALVPHRLQA